MGTAWVCTLVIYGYRYCIRRINFIAKKIKMSTWFHFNWCSFDLLFKWTSILHTCKINSVISSRNNFQITSMVRAREHPNTDRASDLLTYLGTCWLGDESISHCCSLQKNCDRRFYILGSGAFLGPVLSNPFQIHRYMHFDASHIWWHISFCFVKILDIIWEVCFLNNGVYT